MGESLDGDPFMKRYEASRVLDAALYLRDLLLTSWTQGALARDKHGKEVDPNSPEAVSFCIDGARTRAINDVELSFSELLDFDFAMGWFLGNNQWIPWNDESCRTKDEIMEFADFVIEYCKGAGEQEDAQ